QSDAFLERPSFPGSSFPPQIQIMGIGASAQIIAYFCLSILYCIEDLEEFRPFMCIIEMREIVLSSILTTPLLYSIILRILPDDRYITALAPLCKPFMPAFLLVSSKNVILCRASLILTQILVEFRVEEGVALLPVSRNQPTQAFDPFPEPIIVHPKD